VPFTATADPFTFMFGARKVVINLFKEKLMVRVGGGTVTPVYQHCDNIVTLL
jgi:hypothetical protein